MGRGNRHGVIFKSEEDYCFFLRILKEIQDRNPFVLHAICLMTNHFHLELTTKSNPIWKIMQQLMNYYVNYYARTFNQRHGYQGHLFDGRYVSCLIEDERYFLEVSRYIHLNPVKAMMVREPIEYKYSSYGVFVSGKDGLPRGKAGGMIAEAVDTTRILSAFRNDPREQYRMFVEGKISHAEQEMLIMKDVKENESWLPW